MRKRLLAGGPGLADPRPPRACRLEGVRGGHVVDLAVARDQDAVLRQLRDVRSAGYTRIQTGVYGILLPHSSNDLQ